MNKIAGQSMRKTFITVLLVAGAVYVTQASAIDLIGSYKHALDNDPTFKGARAKWLSDGENVRISRSALLPQLDIGGSWERSYVVIYPSSGYGYDAQKYSLTLTQTLFNYASWSKLKQAKANVRAATAVYATAAQDLMLRTAQAYFGVLQANDVLRYTVARKNSIARQLARTRQRYAVGLVAITDVYQAKANYDLTTSDEIAARNDLADKKEELREITGMQYEKFAKLGQKLPLVKPNPESVAQWVSGALKQNYNVAGSVYALEAARENVKVQAANRLPTLNLQGSTQYYENSNSNPGARRGKSAVVGLSLDFPVIQGGLVTAKTNQAIYDFEKAGSDLEKARRTVISQTTQDYLGVLAAIAKLKSDKQAVVSARSSLESTEAGYIVGTQTMVDVLNEQTKLYDAQTQYAKDQYAYLLKTLELKSDAGTLAVTDLQIINGWLVVPKAVAKKPANISRDYHKQLVTKKGNDKVYSGVEKQLLALNPHHYSIQLLASTDQKGIIKFVENNKIAGKTYVYSTSIKNKKWYKLVVGDYQSRKQADNAANKLTKKLKVKLWVRKLAAIQKELG